MESSNFAPLPETQPPSPGERPESEEPKEESGPFAWLKNFFIVVVLLAIVVSCAFIVFNLGKGMMAPRRPQAERIPTVIPEPPPSLQALQKALSAEAAPVRRELPAQRHLRAARHHGSGAMRPARTSRSARQTAASGHYFKVQAAVYRHKSAAAGYAEKVRAAGFAIYVKKVTAGWRVQVGAFKTRAEAEKLQRSLGEKGFKSVVIYE